MRFPIYNRSKASIITTEFPRITTVPIGIRWPDVFSSYASSSTTFRNTYKVSSALTQGEGEHTSYPRNTPTTFRDPFNWTKRRLSMYYTISFTVLEQEGVFGRTFLSSGWVAFGMVDEVKSSGISFFPLTEFLFADTHWSARRKRVAIFPSLPRRTQNFHSPSSLLTRINLCLIVSLDEATVSRSSLCAW